jgi:hypothetical protein
MPPVVAAEQAWHGSVQELPQQTPSTQKPDWQWDAAVQGFPSGWSGAQAEKAVQYAAGTHCASLAQLVAHAPAVAQKYGEQLVTVERQCPAPSHCPVTSAALMQVWPHVVPTL